MPAAWRLLPALLLMTLQALWMATPHPCGQTKEATSADCHPCCVQPCPTEDSAPAPGGQKTLCAMACAPVGAQATSGDLQQLVATAALWAPTPDKQADLPASGLDHVPIAAGRISANA